MPIQALIWVTFLAPFVIWPPIVIAIMRRMADAPDGTAARADHIASTAWLAGALLHARTERCGASVVIALGPAARLVGREPAVICLEQLLAKRRRGRPVCTMSEGH